ncbi:MAG: right-handed parallel beta-helix repeat-containing protein [Bacteroidota bacterium]
MGGEIFILPRRDWVANYLPIKSVDQTQRVIETTCPGTYNLTTPPTWTKVELFYQIENIPEFLDEPGEWYLDKAQSAVYLISRDGNKPKGIIAPGLDQMISITGNLEEQTYVKDVTIEGLTFMHADRMTWEHGRIGVQHDWEVVDGQWSCIKAKGVINLTVRDCLFENSGGDGVRIDLTGWNNRITHNEFRMLGGSAVSLIGYAPGTQDKLHNNHISNNYIHHCAELWWLQAGITVCQSSSNVIANNLVHDMPYNGMTFVGGRSALFGRGRNSNSVADGLSYVNWDEIPEEVDEWHEKLGYISTRDNLVEHNEVYQVVQQLGDGNGIYFSGTGTGNLVQKNYIHDISSLSSAGGLRFDNDTWFCTMRDNVVWNVNTSSIVSKWVNNIENNIMINSGVRSNLNLAAGPKWGTNIRRNIVVNKKSLFEPTMNQWMTLEDILVKGIPEECKITDNIFFVSDDQQLGEQVVNNLSGNVNADGNLHADPLFYDLAGGDFRLKDDSPALMRGFIPIEDYGLTEEVGRNR